MELAKQPRIIHAEKIEQTVDDIIDLVLCDNNVEQIDQGTPVSSETWLACKAKILALVTTITSEEM